MGKNTNSIHQAGWLGLTLTSQRNIAFSEHDIGAIAYRSRINSKAPATGNHPVCQNGGQHHHSLIRKGLLA